MKLELLNDSHIDQVKKWLSDESLMYYMDTEPQNLNLRLFVWVIISNDKPVGWTSLFNIDESNKKAEFGIAIPEHQSMVCYKATLQVLKFGFNELGLNRIYIRPLKSDLRENDQRERFGFVKEGIERQSVKRGDIYEDVVIFSILKDDFERKWC